MIEEHCFLLHPPIPGGPPSRDARLAWCLKSPLHVLFAFITSDKYGVLSVTAKLHFSARPNVPGF